MLTVKLMCYNLLGKLIFPVIETDNPVRPVLGTDDSGFSQNLGANQFVMKNHSDNRKPYKTMGGSLTPLAGNFIFGAADF